MSEQSTDSTKKIILHIVISFATGGLERVVLDLIQFSGDRFNHRVVCLERIGDLGEARRLKNVVCFEMKQGLHLKYVLDLCAIIKAGRIDLIHTHNEKALFYGAISGFMCGIPVVHTKHGKNRVNLKARLRNNLLARLCKRIIAVSRDAAAQCIREEKIPPAKVMVVLNGVDIEAYSARKDAAMNRLSLGIDAGVPIVGIVARLAEVKDHATLFQACNIVNEKQIDFRLVVIGDGPLKGSLEKLSVSLGLHNKILFTGTRHDIADLLNIMDIFVLSSISEGISMTLIEAMSCSLPIVATNVGGNPEVIIDGKTGFLVPSQNAAALADKLVLLIQNPDMRKRMGDAGRDRAVNNFSMQNAVLSYEECYRQVIENK